MEMLNEYLQRLLSSCSDELRLEPDKKPYLVSDKETIYVANVALKGTQISSMVFPLIPPDAKSALPHSPEVEFALPHNLGNFNFTVQKSPAGFIVTIRPMLVDSSTSTVEPQTEAQPAKPELPELGTPYVPPSPEIVFETAPASDPLELPESDPAPVFNLESSSANYVQTISETVDAAPLADLLYEDNQTAEEYVPSDDGPEIEIVSVNDPEYQTVFSDNAAYEPPGRRDDFGMGEYVPPTQETFVQQENFVQQDTFVPTPSPATAPYVPQAPAEAAFVPAAADSGMSGVGTDSYSKRKLKPAFSSARCTRASACNFSSIKLYCCAGADGDWFIVAAGPSGAPVSSTRKHFARVSGNANVRTWPWRYNCAPGNATIGCRFVGSLPARTRPTCWR